MRLLARLSGLTAWVLAVLVIGLGVAGAGAVVNPVPDETTRPELFARIERAVAPGLAALAGDLDAIDVAVESLAGAARAALVDLSARDPGALARDLHAGDALILDIEPRVMQVQTALEGLPYDERRDLLGQAARGRISAARDAIAAVLPLAGLWSRLASSAVPSANLTTALTDHDQRTFAAVQQGEAGDYAAALRELAGASARLDDAQAVRDEIAALVDTTTIDQWIARNRRYDTALVGLYADLRASGGVATTATRAELAAVEAARQLLPPDTRALIIIIADLAQGGLNQAAIGIERARGSLAEAAAAVH
jgi:hypothetical protein